MIEKVNVVNFRGFRELEVSDLKKVNLLVGPNSSGKSAFLESLFISSSSTAAQIAFQLRAIRRMGGQIISPTDATSYRSMWEDLFYDFNHNKKISIKISGQPNADSRSLSIEYYQSATQELPFGKQDGPRSGSKPQETGGLPQIEFRWKKRGQLEILSKPKFTANGLQIEGSDVSYFPALWFSPGSGDIPEEHAKRFSDLSKRGDADRVKAAITKEFSFIKDLSIQYQAGIPMMFADVERMGPLHKMPVPLLSDGINRLLGICLGIAYFKGGMILIDQIEDGFHHKLLPSIWSSIYSLAIEYDVQLFISTHSAECLDALLPVVKGHEDDFCLLRATRTDDDGCTIRSLSGNYLESALEQDFEVR